MENNQNQIDEQKKKKKKRILLIIFGIAFLVPIGFGIYNLIPDPIPPTRSYSVELKDNYNNGLTLSKNIAYPDYNFVTDIMLNRDVIADKVMPDALGESDVLCLDKPITYTYNVNQDKFSARLTIPKENIKGKIMINVPLVTPTETFPITLEANGGKFEDESVEKTFNVIPGQTLNDLEGYSRPSNFREGYHFTHWELGSDRSKKLYENNVIPFAPEGATYVANCDLNEIKVNINPGVNGAFPGMGPNELLHLTTVYDTTINQIEGYLGEPKKTGYKFLYYKDINNKHYSPTDTVTIPDEWDDNFGLEAVYSEDLIITLDPNGGSFPGGTPAPFDTYRGITLSELEGYVNPTPPFATQEFTHWTITGDDTNYYEDTQIDKAGSITLVANYTDCEHESEPTEYTVIKNKLYGICPDCHARKPVSDLSKFSGKFLMIENNKNSSGGMHEISEMTNIVNTAPDHSILDIYFINGEYELGGSRGAGQKVITVNARGILNDENKPNASILCTRSSEYPYPRYHLFINFVFENLKMIGEDRYDDGFYFGLYASTITYNHCSFIGKQSFYSDQVICNDCDFDSSNMQDQPDYAIYSYSSFNIEFNRCNFVSDGKAVKIYSEGAGSGAVFKFTDCDFKIKNPTGKEKAAIQVDSSHQSKDDPYKIYITSCTQTGYAGLYADTSDRAKFIVTNE